MYTNRELIGQAVKEHRKRQGLKQSELHNLTGINSSTISEIENGKFTGSIDIVEKVLDGVGLQLTVKKKEFKLPKWDELDNLFNEDD